MAVAFIGGAELAASYWLGPPVFHKIVDPVVEKTEDLFSLLYITFRIM